MTTMPLELAVSFVALLCLFTVGLALNVSWARIARRIPHGEGPHNELSRSIRAHANSVEHLVPIGLLLVAYALLEGRPSIVALIGSVALVSRALMTIGIVRKGFFGFRRLGALGTYLVEIALVGIVLHDAIARMT